MTKNDEQFKLLVETPIPQLIIKLSAPTMLSMLVTSIYSLADTFFVGQIGTSASGAIGIVSSLMALIQAISFTFGHGSGSIISRKLGAKDVDGASTTVSTAFFTAMSIGVLISVFGLIFLEPLMSLLGSTQTILPYAADYGRFILIAAPFMMGSFVLNNVLRYEGKAKFAMIGLVSGGLLNIALDPLFIFGFNMGTGGAGLATGVSQIISFFILLSMFLRGKTASKIKIKYFSKKWAELNNILITGLPSFGRQGLASIAGLLLNISAGAYGDEAVSAMSIVTRVMFFLFSFILGTAQGFQPVAGFNFGAQKYKRVRYAAIFTLVLSMALSAVVAVFFFIFATPLLTAFRDDPNVIAIALPAFYAQTLVGILTPINAISSMLFQCIGKSGKAMLLSCLRQGIFFLPLIIVLPRVVGLAGVQYAQAIADAGTALISLIMFLPYLAQLKKMKEQ